MPEIAPVSSSPTARRMRRLLLRVALVGAALVLGLAAGTWWYFTRSSFIIEQVAPRLEAKLGGNVQIAHARYLGNGVLAFEELTLQAPFPSGAAAQILNIGRAEVTVDEGRLWHGEVLIKNVTLDDVILRLSENGLAPGVFNYQALQPDWSLDDVEGSEILPSIRINSAVIELGLHIRGAYIVRGRRRVAGHMYPSADGGGTYSFELGELDENGVSLGASGILINGQWNVQTLAHRARIDGLALDERALEMCPQMARIWWERMDLEGRVDFVTTERTSEGRFTVELHLEEMALTIPIVPEDFWVRYRPGHTEPSAAQPRMRVSGGRIRLDGDRVELTSVRGEVGSTEEQTQIVGVPYDVTLTIEQLPSLDWEKKEQWVEEVLASAPFRMTIQNDGVRLPNMADDAVLDVELPQQLAVLLDKFKLSGGSLDTEIQISRAPPVVDDSGQVRPSPILTKGQAYINDASGAYDKFSYLLDSVNGHVEFDNEHVTIDLTGKGSGDAVVTISGTITPPGNDAAVSLTLVAHDVPLDDRFRQALRPGERATFDSLLHRPSFEALQSAGLLVDDAAIERARDELANTKTELAQQPQGEQTDETQVQLRKLRRTIDRLESFIETGPFELGGLVDLDLSIDRLLGQNQKTSVTGTVTVQSAGVLYDRFPYPTYVRGGVIRVEHDRISLGDGLQISTSGMGMGTATGDIKLPRDNGSERAAPDLQISILGDSLNDVLFAAVGPIRTPKDAADGATEDRAASILSAIGLTGMVNYTGTVSTNADQQIVFDFAVKLSQGSAAPTDELLSIMRDLGLLWPRGFSLDSVEGEFRVTPSRVELADVNGRRGDGRVMVSGFIGLGDDSDADVTVRFDDLAFEKYIVNLAPGEGERRAAALWDRYQPHGTYDAELHYRAAKGKPEPVRLVIWPQTLEIQIDDRPVQLARERGSLSLQGTEVVFEDLALRVRSHNGDNGLLVLNGSYGLTTESQELQVDGMWTEGELSSPLITEVMALIGAQAEAKQYAGYQPSGSFDAQFTYHSPIDDRPATFLCKIQPHTVAFRVNDVPISLELEEESQITFLPDQVLLSNVAGHNSAVSFRIDGVFDVRDLIEADLRLSYAGGIDGPELRAFLPAQVRSTIDALAVEAAQGVRLEDGHLTMKEIRGDGNRWQTTFAGRVDLQQASFHAGVDFSEVDGAVHFLIDTAPDANSNLDIRMTVTRAKALGREISNAEACITFNDDRTRLVVDELRADLCSGIVTGEATIGLALANDYTLSLEIAGVDLKEFTSAAPGLEGSPRKNSGLRGELFGSLNLAGSRDEPLSRRGRGAARIIHAQIANMPVALRLLQLLELMPPISGSLDFADAAFYITGDRVVFSRLSLECPTLRLLGEGEMDFNSLELDLRFRTRGTLGLVQDIVGGISDRLVAIAVTGPLSDPEAKIVPLPAISVAPKPGTSKWPEQLGKVTHAD